VILTAGVADAASRVGPNGIRNNAVRSRHIQNGQVRTPDIRNNAVTAPKIRNNAVTTAKIRNGHVRTADIQNNAVTSAKIRNGTIALGDLSAAARNSLTTTYAGPNWSIVDRNVQGNGDSALRAGPTFRAPDESFETAPPAGIGSLGMRVGATSDKATFGNQVDFGGQELSTIDTLSYYAFSPSGGVSPALQFELNPNLQALPTTTFTTLSFEPPGIPASTWTQIDPIAGTPAGGGWGMSGAAGTTTGCTLTTPCTWEAVQTALDDSDDNPAVISFSVQFSLGSGAQPVSTAVDALQINDDVYDFEPFGVSVVAP
jgi:hypothetical protein